MLCFVALHVADWWLPLPSPKKKNVTLTSGHDILEFFVVFGIDSITIIIQNDDTAPQFYGIF
jgi:hypothetical protein